MTQGYTPASLEEILIDYVHRKDDTDTTQEATVDEFRRWLAAHDAQIRAEALTLTEGEQKLVVDALYSESYRDKVCSANTITDYDERQAEFRRIDNELSLGLFPMIAKHRKEQES